MELEDKRNIIDFIDHHGKIMLYGTGRMASSILNYLQNLGMGDNIVACLVSPGRKDLDMFHNLPVYETDDIPCAVDGLGVLIAATHVYYNEIAENLHRVGINSYMMIPPFEPPFIEITTKIGCSLNCRYCPQHTLITKYFESNKNRQSVISLENFKQYLKKIPKHVQIVFSGMCEPFLNKDCSAMIKFASDNGYSLKLATSLWGADQEDIQAIRDIDFDAVILHLPDQQGATPLASDVQKHHELVKNLLQIERNGKRLVSGISCHGELHERYKDLAHLFPMSIPLAESLFDRAGNLEYDELFHPHIEGGIRCVRTDVKKIDINVILPDGTVLLCCMDYGMEAVLGNLSIQPYEDIVYGNNVRQIIEDMHTGIETICNKCIFAVPYES